MGLTVIDLTGKPYDLENLMSPDYGTVAIPAGELPFAPGTSDNPGPKKKLFAQRLFDLLDVQIPDPLVDGMVLVYKPHFDPDNNLDFYQVAWGWPAQISTARTFDVSGDVETVPGETPQFDGSGNITIPTQLTNPQDDKYYFRQNRIWTAIQQATETIFGWLKIATQALVHAGVDDTTAITPKKLHGEYGIPGGIATINGDGTITLPTGSTINGNPVVNETYVTNTISTAALVSQGGPNQIATGTGTGAFPYSTSGTNTTYSLEFIYVRGTTPSGQGNVIVTGSINGVQVARQDTGAGITDGSITLIVPKGSTWSCTASNGQSYTTTATVSAMGVNLENS